MTRTKRPSFGGLFAILCLFVTLGSSCQTRTQALTVFCAASLSATVEETAREESLKLALNSGGSNTLVRQVLAGAESDLLLLADDRLAKEELVPKGYRLVDLASNELVVIAPKSAAAAKVERVETLLPNITELAVAEAKTAPLGLYTEQALQGWPVRAKRIPLQDAGAVVSSVALGHAPYGIVYRSDALAEPKTEILAAIPRGRHSPVRYVAALKPDAPPEAVRLVDSLLQGKGRKRLEQAGFLPPAPAHQ